MRRLVSALTFAAFLLAPALAPALAQGAKPPGKAVAPTAPVSRQPAEAASANHRLAECMWTGQRIVSLLWRDDVNTAREQTRFYELFGCPANHLSVAFRCVIERSENQPDQNDLNARVYGCWMAPDEKPQED